MTQVHERTNQWTSFYMIEASVIKELNEGTEKSFGKLRFFPVGIYLLKVNNRNTRTRCEICSKLTIKTPERR